MYHGSDQGYQPDIIVFCDFGDPWSKRKYVQEGTSSTRDCGTDTDQIWIRQDEELWCKSANVFAGSYLAADAPGRHKINDLFNGNCALTRD